VLNECQAYGNKNPINSNSKRLEPNFEITFLNNKWAKKGSRKRGEMDKREDEGSLSKSEAEARGYARLALRDNPLSAGGIDLLIF
jgi:hypothetical protein